MDSPQLSMNLRMPAFHAGLLLLSDDLQFVEEDLYFVIYAEDSVPLAKRRQLKELGWRLTRHTRTNEEIWIFNKYDEETLRRIQENAPGLTQA